MAPAGVLAVMDHEASVMEADNCALQADRMRQARAAVAALAAERDALRDAAQQYLDDYESDSGMQGAKYYAEQFRAALAGAGHDR